MDFKTLQRKRRKKQMGKFGWKSGYVFAQNLQADSVDITTDSNGDGTATYTFSKAFKNTPKVVLTAQESDTTGTLSINAKSHTSFTAQVDGSSVTGQALTVGFIAMDDTR